MTKQFKDGELSLLVLKSLSRASLGLDNLIDRLLTPGFGHKGQFTKDQFIDYHKRCRERKKQYNKEEFLLEEKVKLAVLINRLQKNGLVKKEKIIGRKAFWVTTSDGLEKILKLEEKLLRRKQKNLPPTNYPMLVSKRMTVIVFDISEKEKHKRGWLRAVLKRLNFKMLQKSVWVGNNQLPPDFIRDLKTLKIINQVKIFSVVDEGSIEDV